MGLVGLIDPVTNQFNHEKVIELRGGRKEYEYVGNTKDIGLHHVLGSTHALVQSNAPTLWEDIGGHKFDRYDIMSFFYGIIIAT